MKPQGSIINGKFVVYEDVECEIFANWLDARGLIFSHVASETWTTSQNQKARNKRVGVKKGVPDYIVITPRGVVFVEMKRKTCYNVSKEQKAWIAAINKCDGTEAKVCHGADEAIAYIKEFLPKKSYANK